MSSDLERRYRSVMMPTYDPLPILPASARGSIVTDIEGRDHVDFAGGVAVTGLGHCHPALVAALKTQADTIWHLSNTFANEPALVLAERLTELTFADRAFFSNSGAEANEAALKLARRHAHVTHGPHKHEIVGIEGSFHGRTFFTVATGGTPTHAAGYGPLPAGIVHTPPNDIEALEAAVSDLTCAVILEPILGQGGVLPLDRAYIAAARDLCDAHDALLIVDEIQCGVGRSGALFVHQQMGITPDILTTAKALGGGFPIGATLATEAVSSVFTPGSHGSTFGGNPLACAVANAVLDEVTRPELLSNVAARHDQLITGLDEIGTETGLFTEVRGAGLLLGIVLAEEYAGRARDVQLAALEAGVMILTAGPRVLRLGPALNLTEAEAEMGLRGLARSARSVTGYH